MLITFKNKTPEIHKNVFVADNATVVGDVKIGKDSNVWFGVIIRSDSHRTIIGESTNIQDLSVLHGNEENNLTIGDYVTVGHRAILHGCRIGNRVLVGMGAIIMNGAHIGDDTIVAAGALVTEGTIVPPKSLIMGVPAKIKRELTDSEIAKIVFNAKHYVDFAKIYMEEK